MFLSEHLHDHLIRNSILINNYHYEAVVRALVKHFYLYYNKIYPKLFYVCNIFLIHEQTACSIKLQTVKLVLFKLGRCQMQIKCTCTVNYLVL